MTKFIKLGLIALVAISIFSNCSKKSETKPTVTTVKAVNLTKIDADLKAINAKYAHAGARTTGPKGWATAGADVAAAGGALRSTWGLCATGWGGLAAGALTVLSGAVASAVVYNNWVGEDIQQDTIIRHKLIANVGSYTIPNPYHNPCDPDGATHNQLVRTLLMKPTQLPLTYNYLMFAQSDLTTDQQNFLLADNTHQLYNIDNFVLTNSTADVYAMINQYYAGDTDLQNIMTQFMNGYNQLTDVNTAMTYINAYENYFINTTTNLSAADQGALLESFSVAKYSTAMWNDAMNN